MSLSTDNLKVGDYGIIVEDSGRAYINLQFKVKTCYEDSDRFFVGFVNSPSKSGTRISTKHYGTRYIPLCPAMKILFGVK